MQTFFKKKFNIIVVPNSAGKGVQWQVHGSVLLASFLVLFLFFGISLYLLPSFWQTRERLRSYSEELGQMGGQLEQMQKQINDIEANGLEFQKVFVSLLTTVRAQAGVDLLEEGSTSLLGASTSGANGNVGSLNDFLKSSTVSVTKLRQFMEFQDEVFSEIPSVWPLEGGQGQITFQFGPQIHPVYRNWYVHRGIDISNGISGTPVVATADGEVIERGYSATGLGVFVVIKHRYGFVSTYGHLRSALVGVGQKVKRGERVGLMGSTGLVTGVHLHYELRLGTDLLNPYPFLTMR